MKVPGFYLTIQWFSNNNYVKGKQKYHYISVCLLHNDTLQPQLVFEYLKT